ncbi:hypothetical protein O6B97_05365 [Campylobacter ureolyticus]|uniref:hypothetical protein n=1 Tax=Campylobacter ureolyticus TaxID=827 RepID=UPI0022B46144|nr:hypothetical protein [Campylobacter ureolyticus]MCZ6105918.1 hypothetical protein [Campylobacter ureolyticus]MCZ6133424.1 hypothetical protein [Campylobacter ureolyticus]MCZ6158544.1 hypothetical protein [Campylobacter ureolyticus]MCZ6169507.1 hypothetical protein [Campylobacter ureolyticus]MCZ6186521.1 hypothetical protein [Campylobacter ureolyticus]
MELFSEYFKNLNIQDDFKFAYLVGAYSKAIIDSSYYSEISKQNETFKKWLSNRQLIKSNLIKIFNKANEFERKLKLESARNSDLSELITSNYNKNANLRNSEVSFYFLRGFNDYKKFKQQYPSKGVNDDSKA